MRVGGIWKLSMKTPRGTLTPVLTLTEAKNKIIGTMLVPGNPLSSLSQGRLNGATATMSGRISVPMPMTLTFNVQIEGDDLSGSCENSVTQPFPVIGVRVGDAPEPKGRLSRWKDFLFGYDP